MFSNLFFITLPNIGKYFPGIHFPRNSLSPEFTFQKETTFQQTNGALIYFQFHPWISNLDLYFFSNLILILLIFIFILDFFVNLIFVFNFSLQFKIWWYLRFDPNVLISNFDSYIFYQILICFQFHPWIHNLDFFFSNFILILMVFIFYFWILLLIWVFFSILLFNSKL